ncbi:hypothetical protein HELRODRAFT_161126 [Helobdella robusta]|uniref:Glycolipid transfer protein domain-containing protein n=1 Tax=Helobdella robusta TaxID=6412 RepID=T1ER43_HELRO|nr:hypothetical protein HELRODRAFT_161126 [Helobdella robusta]ESO01924.1 hypothetical protein HELRODRAFT_161126 [Helobdella robusta]
MAYVFKAKHPFIPPTEDKQIETLPFLEASREILILIDYLGPSFLKSAFHRTRADIDGNITTLQNKYNSNPDLYQTLNSMISDELHSSQTSATVALLWLKRGLEFIFHFCEKLIAESVDHKPHTQSLCDITLKSYELSLKRFHSFIVRGLFYLVAHILPSRKDFFKLLAGGQDCKEEEVEKELRMFVEGLDPNLKIINELYINMGKNEDC